MFISILLYGFVFYLDGELPPPSLLRRKIIIKNKKKHHHHHHHKKTNNTGDSDALPSHQGNGDIGSAHNTSQVCSVYIIY